MKNKLFLTLTLLFLISVPCSMVALSKMNARYGAGAIGICSLLLSRKLYSSNIAFNVVAGIASGFTAYYFLYQHTPRGKVAAAQGKLQKIVNYELATNTFARQEEFFNCLYKKYIVNDLPLVDAHQELTYLINEGQLALVLLQQAQQEANDDFALMQQCQVLQPQLYRVLANMADAVTCIRSHEEYVKQMRIYYERQCIEAQNRIAAAQERMADS